MKLSVIIPVYNEKETISPAIRRVIDVPIHKEIIVVDDGSTDGTGDILRDTVKEDPEIEVIFLGRNMGKGSAIRAGIEKVSGDFVVIQDADLEYDPMDWIEMLRVAVSEDAPVVYGSRVLGGGPKSSLAFYFGGRLLSVLTNILYRTGITDEPTCYKMFRADIIKSLELRCTGFEFCPEVTAKLAVKGYRIREVPISYNPRRIREGKKIRWHDGITAVFTLLRYRFRK